MPKEKSSWHVILGVLPGRDRLAGLAFLIVLVLAVVVLQACGSKIGLTVDTPPAQEVVLRPSESSLTTRDPLQLNCSASRPPQCSVERSSSGAGEEGFAK